MPIRTVLKAICGPVCLHFSLWQAGRCKSLLLSPRSHCPMLNPTRGASKLCLTASCSPLGSLPHKPVACCWALGAGWGGQKGSSNTPTTLFQAGQNPRSPMEGRLRAEQRSCVPPRCLFPSHINTSCPHRANKISYVEEQGVGGGLPERSFCCEGRTESTGE